MFWNPSLISVSTVPVIKINENDERLEAQAPDKLLNATFFKKRSDSQCFDWDAWDSITD